MYSQLEDISHAITFLFLDNAGRVTEEGSA
jgi:hypothetical protein